MPRTPRSVAIGSHQETTPTQAPSMEFTPQKIQDVRLSPPGLNVLLIPSLHEFRVREISAHDIRIEHEGWRFDPGALLKFDMIGGYKVLLKNVKARVTSVHGGEMSCRFENVPLNIAGKLLLWARLERYKS